MIYFVRDSTGAVKIGLVSSLEQMRSRLRELRIGSPHRLTVEALIDGGLAEERALHRQWLAHRIRGEWFAGVDVPATAYVVEASGGTWDLFCRRVGNGMTPEVALGPKRRAGRKPGGAAKQSGICGVAKVIAADIGLNWHSVYRVLAGIAANHRRAGDILAHPLARAA